MNAEDICALGVLSLARKIREGELSAVDVIAAYGERIERVNPDLNAIVTLNPNARKEAETVDQDASRGHFAGPLSGVPFTVKDAYDTAGVRTTRGSLIFKDEVPVHDATIVHRLRKAGAILLGKTNLPEFCLGVETENRIFGRTVNPWDRRRTPGGSSGGEAAALAARLSPLGVGSDQGGSLRLPAHYCGIVGFKPTLGRIPVTGHVPDTLHQYATAGMMARHAADLRLALSVTMGPDGYDWAAQLPASPAELASPLEGLRIGYISGDWFGSLEPEIVQAVEAAAKALDGQVASVWRVPDDFLAAADCDLLSEGLYRAEGKLSLSKIIAGHEDLLYPWIQAELSRATKGLSEYLESAARVEALKNDVQKLFREIDVLICPVAPIVAPLCGSDHIVVNGVQRRLRSINRAVQPFNLSSNPAMSVPYCLSAGGLPIGVQVVGRKFEEEAVLKVAEALESLRPAGSEFPAPSLAG